MISIIEQRGSYDLTHRVLGHDSLLYQQAVVIVILLLLFALYRLGYKGEHSLDYEHPAFRSNPRFFAGLFASLFEILLQV